MGKRITRRLRWLGQLVAVAALAATLAACGGGGNGGVRTQPSGGPLASPPPAPPPSSPTRSPPSSPPSSAPPPSSSGAAQPPINAQLQITNAHIAHVEGYTGKGVIIGVVDTGIMRSNPTVAGRILKEYIDVDPNQNNTGVDDVDGHGTWVSEIAAGKPFDQFPGGIGSGADLVSARIIADNAPPDNGKHPPSNVTQQSAQFFEQVNQQLISSGVDVMNNSWGGITWDTSNASVNQAFGNAYDSFVNQHDGLVVFAAGNDSNANPSTIAALPSVAPSLEKGWLTVVAVNSNDPTELASYSNQCGIAMDYCLAAPGGVIVLGKDATASTTNPKYFVVEGTSLAAPQVSGAAALVWQAFPYFTNDLVRQTLLGTADPLGGSQPNTIFGYGELDVGKAVQGPAEFNWGDVSVSFDNLISTWSNDISGTGGLIKKGTGTLILAGHDTYTGGTQLLGGSLQATHSLPGDVTVGNGGTLDAVPGVSGSIKNSGTVIVKGGNTEVGLNYTQTSTGTLSVSLGSVLAANGEADLAGTLNVLGEDSGYVTSDHQNVLTAKTGVNGTFAKLTTSPGVFLKTKIQYAPRSVWLDTTSLNISATAGSMGIATPAVAGAARRVDLGFDALNSAMAAGKSVASDVLQGAAAIEHSPTRAAARATLESLSGQLHAASAAMLFDGIDASDNALSEHVDDVLGGRTRPGPWYAGLGWQGDLQRTGYAGATFRTRGGMLGADFRVGSHVLLGYVAGQSRGFGQLDAAWDHDRTWMDDMAVYGGVVNGPWYASARISRGWYREDMQRLLRLGWLGSSVGSGITGRFVAGAAEGGYQWRAGNTRITPFADVRYQRLAQGAFAEQGGYGFALKADARTIGRLQAGLGLRAVRAWRLGNGMWIRFDGGADWQHALNQYGGALTASFTGFSERLPLRGIGLSRDTEVLRTGLSLSPTPRFGLRLGYMREQGQRQHASSVVLQGSVRF